MQAQAVQAAKGADGLGRGYERVTAQLQDLRRTHLQQIAASDQYDIRQTKTISQSEAYAKRLQQEKVGLAEAWRERKQFNQVLRDQIALQRAHAVSWSKGTDGRISADLIMPRDAISNIESARARLGLFNQTLHSVADNTIKWGKNTQWAGRQLMVGFTVPMGIAAAATGKMAYDIDKSLTSITKVYGDANTSIQETTDTIRETSMQTATNMAKAYGQSAKDTLEITAQFAAAGKTGVELQNAAAAATKARQLNEMDLQTSIDASIAMQTVYGYSAEELGQKWDYINAIANQTVLGANDFAIAIPKVSGVLKEMGASLEDVGVLMTAFKSAGIDAAEGANALKTISFRAVSAYGKGLETFQAMTGQDLKKIVEETNGETIPTLLKMYDAMKNLSTPQRIAVVKDVFGIYQGNKAMILMEQLAGQSQQVAQAIAVGKNSIAENANIANQELERMNNQPFKQIQKAIESVKIEMAKMGAVVLPLVADVVGFVAKMLNAFNDAPDAVKNIILVSSVIIGLIGPLTMLLGLFANLAGNIIKFGTTLGALATGFKITNAEERAAILIGKQATNMWDTQTSAVARLTQQLMQMNAALAQRSMQQVNPNTAPKQLKSYQDMGGNSVYYNQATKRWHKTEGGAMVKAADVEAASTAMGKLEREEYARAKAQQAQAEATRQQAAAQKTLARNIGGTAAGVGMLASMLTDADSAAGRVAQTLFIVGTASALFPGIGVAITKGLLAPLTLVRDMAMASEGRLARAAMAARGFGTSMIGIASKAALPIGAVAAAVAIMWVQANKAADEHADKIKELGKTAETFADVLGFNYQQAAGTATRNDPTGMANNINLAEKFAAANKDAAAAFSEMQGRSVGDKWGAAIAEGVKVKLHGGTAEAAKSATRIALELMGQRFSDAEFEAKVNLQINFDNADELINGVMNDISRKANEATRDEGVGMEGFMRRAFGGGSVTKASAELAKQSAKDAWQLFYNADADEREKIFDKIVESANKGLKDTYSQAFKANADFFTSQGMGTYEKFISKISQMNRNEQGGLIQGILGPQASAEEVKDMQQKIDYLKQFNDALGENMKVPEAVRRNIFNTGTYRGTASQMFGDQQQKGIDRTKEYTAANERFTAAVAKAEAGGRKLSDAEKLKLLNVERAAMGLARATTLTQGFTDVNLKAVESTKTLAETISQMGMQTSEEQVTSTYRSALEGAQGDLVAAASDSLQREADLAQKALDNQMDSAMKSFDTKSEALDKKYDAREKALENKQKAQDNALQKSQDDRKKREEAYYDGRIKAIDATIKKEQAAEDIRQKIFEAEKKRIERMAELYNRNIDFNMALNSGNLDEAAKISNDMRAQTETWLTEDSQASATDASGKRITALEGQKSRIETAKDARLKALAEIEKAENEALKARQQRESDGLKASREASQKRLDAEREARRAEIEASKAASQAIWEDRRRKLEIELATIRAYIPRNEAELRAQAQRIDQAYRNYGGRLTGYGESWSKFIGNKLKENVSRSGNELKTAVNWANIGATIASSLIKGGFGMTPAQFGAWLNGGVAPPGTLFSAVTPKGKPRYGSTAPSAGGGRSTLGGALHSGGIVGGSDYKRTGHSGQMSQSEIMINALKGEAVLNRKATDILGEENVHNLNKGKLPAKTGPWGMEGAMAALAAGAAKRVMGQVLQTVAERKMAMLAGTDFGATPGKAGSYAGIGLSQEQLNNAATIIGVGKGLGATDRDLVVALMTAMQESTLRNLNYGDRDSLGLFQQRNAWGSAEDRTTPSKAARMFFLGGAQGQRGLLDIAGRDKMSLAQAAQAVQVSAYPDAYAKWQSMAMAILGGTRTTGPIAQGFGSGINMAQFGAMAGGGSGWKRPAGGPVTSEYGMRVNPVTGAYRLHAGIDLGAPGGSPIYAARGGTVVSAGWNDGYGNYTIIDHGNGIRTAYAHQSRMAVHAGQAVAQGQVIGNVGTTGNSTGNHLHFEYMKNGQRLNPRQIIPQFSDGGYTFSTGLAELHPKETVLSAPLTQDLHEGLGRFAKGENAQYNLTIDLRGSNISQDVDIERAVEKVMQKKERRVGVKRKIGDR